MPQPDWPFELLLADGKGAIKNLKAPTAPTAYDLQTTIPGAQSLGKSVGLAAFLLRLSQNSLTTGSLDFLDRSGKHGSFSRFDVVLKWG